MLSEPGYKSKSQRSPLHPSLSRIHGLAGAILLATRDQCGLESSDLSRLTEPAGVAKVVNGRLEFT